MLRNSAMRALTFVVISLLALPLLVSCASSEPTTAPALPAAPAPAVAPTAAAVPTAAGPQPTSTAVAAQPAPTVALPTATAIAAGKISYGGTLRYSGTLDTENSLDPYYSTGSGFYYTGFAVLNGLVRLAPDESILPDLAESWQLSADSKTLTFKLRPGVKFHDGTTFDANAVKWSFDYILNPKNVSPRRGEVSSLIKSVDVINDLTLAINMPQPSRPLLAQLADRAGLIVSPTAYQKLGPNFGRQPVGTGPFVFKEFLLDQRVVVVRNDAYWEKGQPYLDTIYHLVVNSVPTQFAMLRTGEVDIVEQVNPSDIPTIRANANLKLSDPFPGRTDYLDFNLSVAPWNNIALRQAISHSIDRTRVVQVIWQGQAIPAHTFIQSGWAHDPNLKPIAYDPVKAKAKLAEAGYPNGVKVRMATRSSSEEILQAEVYQSMMKSVGIDAEIVLFSASDYNYAPNPGFGTLRTSPRVDPHNFLVRRVYSTTLAAKERGINNAEIDKLLDEGVTVFDIAKAKPIYDRIQTILAGDAIIVFVDWRLEYTAMSTRVQNFQWSPDRFHRLRSLWLQK